MNPKGLEIVDLREINILCHLTDKEQSNITLVHIYGTARDLFEGPSALYVTKNDEILRGYQAAPFYSLHLAASSTIVGDSCYILVVLPRRSYSSKLARATHIPVVTVFLAGFDSLVGKSSMEEVPEIVEKSRKVVELSGKKVRKIVVAAEFGAALTADNYLYMWGCGVEPRVLPAGLSILMLECHYDGRCCPQCSQKLVSHHSYHVNVGGYCYREFSRCSKCGDDCQNNVSYPPNPASWKGKIVTVVGYPASADPKIPNLWCTQCIQYGRCRSLAVSNFHIILCPNRHLIDGNYYQTNTVPHIVDVFKQVRDIAAGVNFVLIQTSLQLIITGVLGGYSYNCNLMNPDNMAPVKVACGSNHIAVISDKGDLYTCGVGLKGQLGYTSSTSNSLIILIKVSHKEPVVDVACGENSTVCLLQNGTYVAHGDVTKIIPSGAWSLRWFDAAIISVPLSVNYGTIESSLKHLMQPDGKRFALLTGDFTDVFILLHGLESKDFNGGAVGLCTSVHDASNQTESEHQQNSLQSDLNPSVLQSLKLDLLFGQLLLSDLTLKLADGEFPVHRSVLFASSTYFSQLFTDSESPDVLDMSSYNATAYRGLLKYYYGVPLGPMSWEDMFDLYVLASSYKEDWIVSNVFSILKKSISTTNVLLLHDKAKAANDSELLKECQTFIDAPDFKKSLLDIVAQDADMLTEILRLSMTKKSSS